MALTVSSIENAMWGNKLAPSASIAFDSSYAIGGESLTANKFGLSAIERMIIEPCQGYSFEYDYTNSKVKVFQNAPPIVHEEVVTVTSNVGYLKWPAAHIEYVTDDTDDYRVIPGGLTPTTKQVAVDMGFDLTTGVLTKGERCSLTFLAGDSVSSCKVSYVTQAWKEVTDNMVQACMTSGVRTYGHADLAFTAGTPDIVALGEDFVALQSVCWDNGGTLTPMSALKDDATEGAGATECVVDFRKATTYGEIGFNETDAVDTTADVVYFNYIRDPGSGFLYDRFTNAEITDATDTLTFTGTPLIYCTCGGIPMESTTKKCLMTGVGDTLAAGEGHWTSHPYLPGVTLAIAPVITMHADTDDDAFPAWICGDPSEIDTVPLECPNGVNLSNLSAVKITAIGY
jgi:hypothetical protein